MKQYPLTFIITLFILFFSYFTHYQVTNLKYKLWYNDTTGYHDMYIHITEGNSTTAQDTIQKYISMQVLLINLLIHYLAR
jgi:hypothetical protein